MENIDIFRLLLGILTSLMMIYLLVGLFPVAEQRQQIFERRIKRSGGTIKPMSRVRRAVATLMFGMFAIQLFAEVFHCDLSTLTGIGPTVLFLITFFLLPPLVMILGIRGNRH